jgi:hypothetical protein
VDDRADDLVHELLWGEEGEVGGGGGDRG